MHSEFADVCPLCLLLFLLAASGKTISAEEISYVPSLDIDSINITRVATTLLEVPSRRIPDSDDAFIVDEHPSKSSPELGIDLSESEVNPPAESEVNASAGAEVNVAATSASLDNVKLRTDFFESEVNAPAEAKVNVDTTSASPDNFKLRTDFSGSEVTLPAGSEVNPPAGSEVNAQTGEEVNAPAEAEVNVAATLASLDNVKLSSTFLDLLPSEPEIVGSDYLYSTSVFHLNCSHKLK